MAYRPKSVSLFICLCFILLVSAIRAQQVSVCPGGSFNPYSIFSAQLNACGPGSQLVITGTTVNGVPIGAAPASASPTSEGTLTIQVLDNDDDLCQTLNLQVFIAEAGFTASPVPGGCNEMAFVATDSSPGCTHNYNILGSNFAGSTVNYSFENAGIYNVIHTMQCGSCSTSETIQVNVPGVEAELDLTSSSSLFFDGNFQSLVLCSSTGDYELVMNDISNAAASATYNLQITLPDGSVESSTALPAPYTLSTDQSGTVSIVYEVTQNGCTSTVNYSFFFATNFGTTQLDVPIDIGSLQCQDDDFTVTVCPGGCPNNPPGTLYRVVLDCNDFEFETTTVPFTIDIPLNVGSCGSTCQAGGFQSLCACELVVLATRPCIAPASASFCPFRIQPQPNAIFELSPIEPDNTYCQGETVTFTPEWDEIDCDPFNPAPSLCEIQNQTWSITPATGWVNLSANLESFPLDIRFDVPGSYNICFDWQNGCGSDAYCETVCILDGTPPDLDWAGNQVFCLGDQINPSAAFSQPACANTSITWEAADTGILVDNEDELVPTLTFNQVGNREVDVEIEGLCDPFQETFTYTICDAPVLTLSQTTVTLCVGQEFCLNTLATTNWNNCVGDLTWTIPGEVGSPFVNPLSGETCIERAAPETFTVSLEAINNCGSDAVSINIVVEESPSCALLPPPPFCPGGIVNLDLPAGALNPTWYASQDGVNFNPLPAGMPQSPAASTYYYVESTVNGCFCISNTVLATLIPAPVFNVSVSASSPCPGDEVSFSTAPYQGEVNWLDGAGNVLATADSFSAIASVAISLTAELAYGQDGVTCSTTASGGFVPEPNPLFIDCAGLPSLLCDGDAPVPLPNFGPAGGTVSIGNPGNILQTNPSEIDPVALGTGDYYFYYTLTGQGTEGCTFRDSCAFSISLPQVPSISPAVDSLCYGEVIVFEESSGLSGAWSSTCPGAIDPVSGAFDAAAANCPPGSLTEITYGGNCIMDATLPLFLIDVPALTILSSADSPCPGDTVSFGINPANPEVTWSNAGGDVIVTGAELSIPISSATTVFAAAEFGSASTSCISEASLTVSPEVNPIVLDCSAFPANFCEGNAAVPLPAATPAGGAYHISDASGIVLASPAEIDPSVLGPGDFSLVYEISNFGAEGCAFVDSCSFAVLLPQTPQLTPQPDSICYNTPIAFEESTGLDGSWSADCPGAIDAATGIFDPAAAGCTANASVTIGYGGDCILDTSFEVYVHAVPTIATDVPQTVVCSNDCIALGANITGNFDTAVWNLSWPGGNAQIAPGADFCPAEWSLLNSADVTAVLQVNTATAPVCTVLAEVALEVVGIPDEDFELESPQCIAGGIVLPACGDCAGYDISFTDILGNTFDCTEPGAGCFAPDTGVYVAAVVFDYGFCQSDPRELQLIVADSPYLEIVSQAYNPCTPVAAYEVVYGGYQISSFWETNGILITSDPTGPDSYNVIINHNTPIQVDTLYTDVLTVSNFCGSETASAEVYHQALPDFTIDPDGAYFCSSQEFNLELGFAQPLQLDSLSIAFSAGDESGDFTIYDFPDSGFPFSFISVSDTLAVNFSVTAVNACGTITKTATVYVMPRDVAADVDFFYESPLCPGDTIPLVFNSSGNVDLLARTVTASHPDIKVLNILGAWYLVPQQGIPDGNYSITLTEFGFCGVDVDVETLTTGPTLALSFEAEDVCLGNRTRFVPSIGIEAQLQWEFEPEAISNFQGQVTYRYGLPGLYFPILTASHPDFCDGFYSRPVEVFEPVVPEFRCDVGCDGFRGDCSIDFNDGFICIEIGNDSEIQTYEWRVRGQFIPEYSNAIRIPVDQLRACEDNTVQVRILDINGCREVGRRNIAFNDGLIHIPNAFTPNADSYNDFWQPVILGEPFDYELTITDRWGRIVWQTNDYEAVWRGEDAGSEHYVGVDVYSYILKWKPCNRAEDKMKVLTGHITVVR